MGTTPEIVQILREEEKLGKFEIIKNPRDLSSISKLNEKDILFNAANDMFLYLDKKGRISDINKSGLDISGFEKNEVIDKVFWKLPGVFSIKNLPKFMKIYTDAIRGKSTTDFICNLKNKYGKKYIMKFSTYPIFENSKLKNILVVSKDMSDEEKAKEKLTLSEKKFENIFKLSPSGIILVDKKGCVQSWNVACEEIFGWKSEEVIGNFNPTVPNNMKNFYFKSMRESLKNLEIKALNKNKGLIDILISTTPLYDPHGKFIGSLGVMTDITEEKKAEEEIKQSQENYETIFNSSTDSIFIHDYKTGEIIDVNKCVLDKFGYTKEEIKNLNVGDISVNKPPYTQKEATEWIKKAASEGPQKFEWLAKSKKGELIWYENVLQKVSIDGEERVIVSGRDITERKKSDEELSESEKLFRTLVEQSTIGVYIHDPVNNKILYANPLVRRVLGFSKDEMNEVDFFKYLHPDDSKLIKNRTKKRLKGKKIEPSVEVRLFPPKKEMMWVRLYTTYIDYKGQIVALASVIDITNEKNAKEKIKESEEKYRNIVDMAPDGILTIDLKGVITSANSAFTKLSGFSNDEIVGKHYKEIPTLFEQDIKTYSHLIKAFISGGTSKSINFRWKNKKGEKRLGQAKLSVMKSHGKRVGVQAIVRDLTEQKKAENELKKAYDKIKKLNIELENKVKERTETVEKLLKQKDEFIDQLSHDLKNPLTPLTTLLPIIKDKTNNEEISELVDVSIRNTNYIKNLVKNTLHLARLNSPNINLNYEEINLYDEINNMIKNQNIVDNNISLDVDLSQNLKIQADKLKIHELFDNLISNSIKYSPEKSIIRIKAEESENFVKISIKDNGIGMTKEQIDNIFSEFYKVDESRSDYYSTGLGLTICKKIVEHHGGKIWAESPGLGKGSIFNFTIKKHQDIEGEDFNEK